MRRRRTPESGLRDNAAPLSPRGRVLENGAPRFFRRIAEGVLDVEDLILRTRELADFLEVASKTNGLDASRLVAVGYSNGANMAASLLLLHPKSLAGAILFRPMVPFTPENLPDLSGKKVLISAGLEDPVVPREQTEQLRDMLKQCHADVALHWQESTHAVTEAEIRFARNWLLAFPRIKRR